MSVKCSVHLDKINQKKKPIGAEVGRISKRITGNVELVTAEDLAKLVTMPYSWTWLPGIMEGARNNSSWKKQQIFAIDIDEGLRFCEAKERLKSFGLDCTFAYSTFSSDETFNKFRIVFFLDNEITSPEDHNEITENLKRFFPEMDKACTDKSRMLFGGKKLIYSNFEYSLDPNKLKIAADVFYVGSAKTDRSRQSRAKKVAEKGKTINTIIEMPKNAEITSVRNFDYETAIKKCRVFREFAQKEWVHHPDLFGIASNLKFVKGGLKWMKNIMDECGKYSQNNYAILPYVRSQKYKPQRLANFSPYKEDHNYKNLLQAGRLKKGEVVRLEELKQKDISEMENQLKKTINSILDSRDKNIHIVKVPTGVGKTESILNCTNVTIATPTHDLKNELKQRIKVPSVITPEIPTFTDYGLNKRLLHFYSCGATKKATRLINEVAFASAINYSFSATDKELARTYLDQLKQVNTAKETIITTHHRGVQFYQHDTIIFDEDPFKTIFFPLEKVLLSDLITLKGKVHDPTDKSLIQKIIEEVNRAQPNVCNSLPKFAFNNLSDIEDSIINSDSISTPILNFFDSEMYIIDENDANIIYFIKEQRILPDKKIIILSATANEWIYKQIYGNRVKFYDMGNVKLKGKLIQDTTHSFSRNNLKNDDVLKYALEAVKDRLVITFANFKHHFKTAVDDIYFGNCQGTNKLSGSRIAIVGTPHVQTGTYVMVAAKLGLNLNPTDFKYAKLRVEYKGLEFMFYTFENESLRNIQFYFIESELNQAVGRARLVRHENAEVLVLSNFPLPEAEFYSSIAATNSLVEESKMSVVKKEKLDAA
ncbi:MAG: hypothetical protein K0B11_03330 [Mariniphaga sp.]|nr:hypothetical protein [Mariniphaga sp.]